jgi:large subunit ribosomal protein L19
METKTIKISPVNMGDRVGLGLRAGDTVRVWQKIQEKGKTRLQAFEGLVLARKHGSEPGATFTVRRVSGGVGVEKIFPLYSPMIDKIEIIKRSKVRRAKLYYIREKAAKEIRRQMRRMTLLHLATMSEMEEKERVLQQAEEAAKKTEEEAKVAEEAEKKAQEEVNTEEIEETEVKEEPDKPKETKSEETATEKTNPEVKAKKQETESEKEDIKKDK